MASERSSKRSLKTLYERKKKLKWPTTLAARRKLCRIWNTVTRWTVPLVKLASADYEMRDVSIIAAMVKSLSLLSATLWYHFHLRKVLVNRGFIFSFTSFAMSFIPHPFCMFRASPGMRAIFKVRSVRPFCYFTVFVAIIVWFSDRYRIKSYDYFTFMIIVKFYIFSFMRHLKSTYGVVCMITPCLTNWFYFGNDFVLKGCLKSIRIMFIDGRR